MITNLLAALSGQAALVGGAAAGVVSVGLYASGVLQKTAQPEPPAIVTPAPVVAIPAQPDPETGPIEAPQPVVAVPPSDPEITPQVEAQSEDADDPATPPQVASVLPGFDVVRVETDGTTLVAGKGAPAARIAILMDGVEIATAQADSAGRFVAFVTLKAANKPRVLSLVERHPDGDLASEATVILAPTITVVARADPAQEATAPTTEPAAATPVAPEDPVAGTDDPLAESPQTPASPQTPTAPRVVGEPAEPAEPVEEPTPAAPVVVAEPVAPVEEPAPAPVAPTVLLADNSGVTVLQAPVAADLSPEAMTSVSLDAITYSDSGEVELAGRGKGQGFVRVYLDNAPITTSRISNGAWETELPNVDTGIYTLRVDEVDDAGTVVSRVETPFKREDRDSLAEVAPVTQTTGASVITVQPGNTLWAIAREKYGEGPLYVRVFEANRDRIRNPDLIYPGQVFDIPDP